VFISLSESVVVFGVLYPGKQLVFSPLVASLLVSFVLTVQLPSLAVFIRVFRPSVMVIRRYLVGCLSFVGIVSGMMVRLLSTGVFKFTKLVLVTRGFLLLLARRRRKLLNVMLGFTDAVEKLRKIFVKDRSHAFHQEVCFDVESLHQFAQFVLGLEVLLSLPSRIGRALFRFRLRKHKKDVDASLWVLFFDIPDELIDF